MGLFKRSRTTPPAAPAAPGKRKRRLLAVLLALLLLAVLAPTLVARTPLRNWIAARVLAQLKGDVRIGGASLGWFTAPAFTDVEVRDADGRTMLRVARIEGSKSLVALLGDHADLGELRVTGPAAHVVCSHDSTNVEMALSYWLQTPEKRPEKAWELEGVALRADCSGGSLVVEDDETGRTWTFEGIDVSVELPRDRRQPAHLKLTAAVADGPGTGHLDADLSARLVETDGPPRVRAGGRLHAEGVPLAVAVPFVRRFEPQAKLDGRLGADLTLAEGDGRPGAPDVRLEGSVSAEGLALAQPLLGPDVLRLAHVEVPCRVALEGSRLLVERLEVRSEVGKASLAGTVDLSRGLGDVLALPGQSLEAELDLARLAGLAPNTLHLTPETRVTSGSLSLHVKSTARPDGAHWEGDLRTSDLEAVYQGQRVTWKEPLTVVFAARQEAGALPVFERFRCDSDFLRAELTGSPVEWTARAGFDLGKLGEHLAGFVDLGPLRLQGGGTARLSARRNPRGGYRVEGDVQFAQLRLTDGSRAWKEDSLTVRLDVVGDATSGGACRVSGGGLHVLAGKDGIDVDLLEPVADVRSFRSARARLRVHGDLARWQGRVASLTGALEGVRAAGQVELDARLRYEPEAVQLEDVKALGHAVKFQGFGLCLDEPQVDFTTSGRCLTERETLELQHTRLSCPSLTAQAPAVTAGIDRAGAVQITAGVTVQGDVARLRRCLLATPPNAPDTLGGSLAGRIDLRPDEGRQVVQLDLNLQNLTVGAAAALAWREPHLHLTGQGVYDALKDSFQVVQLHLDGPALNCDAAGRLASLSSDMELSLDGRLGYDLEKLEPQLRPYLGPGVKLSGRDVRPFHVAGALAAPATKQGVTAPPEPLGRLKGEAALSWQSVQAMGFQVGTAELRAWLGDGLLTAAPIDAALNQGRLHLEPSLRLAPGPMEVYLAKGRAVERARLTPAACAGGLGFALPVLADVAQAEGELSVDLDGGRVPLSNPTAAEAAGRITVHSAQVSPGPLVQELSVLLKGPATMTLARDNVVPFRVVNGRVYHSGLELHFPELVIRTSGSVGLDGSLALVAEMPVPPKWLGPGTLARAAAGQTIRLPVTGTLSKPKLDREALRAAAGQFARDTTENVIRQELDGKLKQEAEKGLKNLFRRK